jgi:hypothetical protein
MHTRNGCEKTGKPARYALPGSVLVHEWGRNSLISNSESDNDLEEDRSAYTVLPVDAQNVVYPCSALYVEIIGKVETTF